ncbi:MAG: hypothetical protein V4561_06515 [Bacteroidota bacterium]
MKRNKALKSAALSLIFIAQNHLASAHSVKKGEPFRQQSIGSSFFMTLNSAPNAPCFYQLNYAYRINPKNVISVEAKTSTYDAPLGIPGSTPSMLAQEDYLGSVKSVRLGLVYQNSIWENFYQAEHVSSFLQTCRNEKKEKTQNGHPLFCALISGCPIQLFNNRFWVAPSLAFTSYWPVNTNLLGSFKKTKNKWPNYFLFEPGFILG